MSEAIEVRPRTRLRASGSDSNAGAISRLARRDGEAVPRPNERVASEC